eukprot:COSAG01_NODE_61340_length_290_cov_0.738220_1_plen_52_part_01
MVPFSSVAWPWSILLIGGVAMVYVVVGVGAHSAVATPPRTSRTSATPPRRGC